MAIIGNIPYFQTNPNGQWKISRSEAEIPSEFQKVHPDSDGEMVPLAAQGRSQKSILERTALFENGAAWNHLYAHEMVIYCKY